MSAIIVVGTQWGDEGKGRVVDWLARDARLAARFNGGDNAGHTVVAQGHTLRLHLVPSGVLHPDLICLIGAGVVVNPERLVAEILRQIREGRLPPCCRPAAGTVGDMAGGPPVAPIERIKLFSARQWEDFVLEWADSLRSEYRLVERCGGSGDMGRDIVATCADPKDGWWKSATQSHRVGARQWPHAESYHRHNVPQSG